jgi:CheY-like chemotaxis protein
MRLRQQRTYPRMSCARPQEINFHHDVRVRIEVSGVDTGIGIPTEHLSRIFEMLSQITPPIERAAEGLGIGLALARGLLELHGGAIQASSGGHGKGAEFIIRLPLAPAEEPIVASPMAREDTACAGNRQKVLVVDDNLDAAASLSQLVKLFGHEVREAHDGVEAIRSADVFRPDVVLLDLGLPKLNGYDAAREIRRRAGKRALRIIAVTGWGQHADRRHSAEAGFDVHLTKPVDATQLRATLDQNRPGRS